MLGEVPFGVRGAMVGDALGAFDARDAVDGRFDDVGSVFAGSARILALDVQLVTVPASKLDFRFHRFGFER